ncbi:hypothetical protein TRICHSKD4_3714 [Roseibium sp. TrichSKD4]|uniref:hypothetical protein n=1 Tax=Roseibium sp. TrichSKD4 TaxID=744980 RepID=UPI0001E56B5F|nr:hypothetical protein [Roseibium sp. TrichSKD4]EFO30139.1 hypothetical protein TRICHSKD4_3714 [Roseibium sp. TrichSKD4]
MLLFLKVDTSGLIRSELPLDHDQQPWAVRIAFDHCDADGNRISAADVLIKANDRPISNAAEAIHGISARHSEKFGLSERPVLHQLADVAAKSAETVAISYSDFDTRVIDSLLLRLAKALGKPSDTFLKRWRRPGLTFLTVQDPVAKQECELRQDENPEELRSPTLDEAMELLLEEPLSNERRTADDNLRRLKRLFFHLREKGHFKEVLAL